MVGEGSERTEPRVFDQADDGTAVEAEPPDGGDPEIEREPQGDAEAVEEGDVEAEPPTAPEQPVTSVPVWKQPAAIVVAIAVVAVVAAVAILALDGSAGDEDVVARLQAPLGLDGFDRADGAELGVARSGQAWNTLSGTWEVRNGAATVADPGEGASMALLNLGAGDQRASVTVVRMTPGAGLVFRYKGPLNFWSVQSAPTVGTWNVIRVVDGERAVVQNLGLQPVGDGTTVAVEARGDRIEVLLNGAAAAVITDDALTDATQVGMIAVGDAATDVAFDSFDAAALGGGGSAGTGTGTGEEEGVAGDGEGDGG